MRFEEHRLAEIELVVAGHEDVRRDHVGERDDVRAAVDARHQRGRQRVAAMREDHVAAWPALARSAFTTAASRAKPPRRLPSGISCVAHQVDVVDQDEGDLARSARRAPSRAAGRDSRRRDEAASGMAAE